MSIHYNNKSVRHVGAGRFLVIMLCASFMAAGCHHLEPVRINGEAQGTYYSVLYYDYVHHQPIVFQPQIDSLLDAFDQTASLWVDSSLLRRVNDNRTDTLNSLLASLLHYSLIINRYTDGAFDCRVGRLVQKWGFSFRERSEPDSMELDSLLCIARGAVAIDTIGGILLLRKQFGTTELDFNAIAQGYASDLVARFLESQGIHDYLVDIGGEVIAHGSKADGSPWKVGVERPAADRYCAPVVQTAIPLRDCSVVTSGSYRKYYERDGVKYSHTIDPVTGRPVSHSLLSVSVVEDKCWLADAMATAYMVMGLDRARQFIATHPDGPGTDAVFFIYDSCGSMKSYATPGWEKLK